LPHLQYRSAKRDLPRADLERFEHLDSRSFGAVPARSSARGEDLGPPCGLRSRRARPGARRSGLRRV